jgi:hypothetical protein
MRVESAFHYNPIKREWRFAEQVVVDDREPDQVIGAQHVKRRRPVAACEIALGVHPLFERTQLLLVDKDREFAGLGKIDHRHEIRRTLDSVVALDCHMGKGTDKVIAGAANLQLPFNIALFANGSNGPGGVNQFSPSTATVTQTNIPTAIAVDQCLPQTLN